MPPNWWHYYYKSKRYISIAKKKLFMNYVHTLYKGCMKLENRNFNSIVVHGRI